MPPQRLHVIAGSPTGAVDEKTIAELLDYLSNTRGAIIFRGASGWVALVPGTSGHVLTSGGPGADPSYQPGGGGGGPHASSHQDGGSDEISVAGLSGLLADPQTPAAHTHPQSDVTSLVADLAARLQVGGQIGGTATSPDVRGMRETGGPTLLALGAVTDAALLKRSGTSVVGQATGAGGGLDADTVDGQHASAFEAAGAVATHEAASDPHAGYQRESEKNAASGYPGLDGSSKLTGSQQVYGSAANTACQGNDSRLSDARPPNGSASGDLTGSYPGPAVANNAITYAKLQDVSATDKVLGRATAGAGDAEEIACTAAGRALIDDADAAAQRTTLGLGALAVKTTIATADIDNDAVTYAKVQNVSVTQRILGRNTAGAGDVEEVTLTQLLDWATNTRGAIVLRGASAWIGLAPGTSGDVLTSNGAGADPSYQAPPGGSGGATITKAAAATVAHQGRDLTWLTLAANSSDITGTTLTTVMSITGVGAGRYTFRCQLVYQASATTTGMGVAVNFTGTTSKFVVQKGVATTGGTAANAAASQAANAAAGNLYEVQGSRTKNALIGAVTVSVDAANSDLIVTIDGSFVNSTSGDLEIKLQAEAAALVVRAIEGSFLELSKGS